MKSYRLASRDSHSQNTIIEIPAGTSMVSIGEGRLTFIAGPCAVESKEGYLAAARIMKEMGVHILRGGAFKPRHHLILFSAWSSDWIYLQRPKLNRLPVATEVLD
jgi:3-deoxy-7-phosphoheptulonate synthase